MKEPTRDSLRILASQTLEVLRSRGLRIITAESCTAGKLAALLSDPPGASEVLEGGFVTYTKTAKSRVLGVSINLLKTEGAVCPQVAIAMAEGALRCSSADIAVAITGVAGPESDEDGNPVGRVCYAIAQSQGAALVNERQYSHGSRERIQEVAMRDALHDMLRILEEPSHRDETEPLLPLESRSE